MRIFKREGGEMMWRHRKDMIIGEKWEEGKEVRVGKWGAERRTENGR